MSAYKENYALIDWSKPLPEIKKREHRGPRSALACPMLIRDQMDELIGQHDGKAYASKSELRKSYKANGLTELGNDVPPPQRPARPRVSKRDIAEALDKVRQGYRPSVPDKLEDL